jgi:phosphatidylinositol glycan class A protein
MNNRSQVVAVTHSYSPQREGIRWLSPGLKVYHVPLPVLVSNATLPNYLTFLQYLRPIVLREHITIIHGHAALSSFAQEAILHSHLFGIRTVFTDHSLFALDDATGILTNKLLAAALNNVDAAICVSHTAYVSLFSLSSRSLNFLQT